MLSPEFTANKVRILDFGKGIASIYCPLSGFKVRSHSAIFLFATAMQKMDCVDVNEGVHMVRFHVHAMDWCVRCPTRLGSTPILCDCNV